MTRGQVERELVKMAHLAKRSGVPTPTIKHYIREGLVDGPAVRTSRNMAYYDARNVERIRVIKHLQTERYLPLQIIGELLEPAPSAKLRAARDHVATLAALAPSVSPPAGIRKRRVDVLRYGTVRASELTRLERAGILTLEGKGATAGYSGVDVELLALIDTVRRSGFLAVFPIDLLLTYRDAVTTLLRFEVEQFRAFALTQPLPMPLPDTARLAMQFAERLIVALRAKLLPALLVAATKSKK